MIKITRNDGTKTVILEVTQGAFETIYKKLGYVPLEMADGRQQTAAGTTQKSDDDLFLDTVKMKPIAQWSKKELQRYAALKELDPKAADLRDVIKQQIDNDQH